MIGKKEKGKPHKRWRQEVEEELNVMGIKKQVGNDQRPSGYEEECIGSQGRKQTVAFEKKGECCRTVENWHSFKKEKVML